MLRTPPGDRLVLVLSDTELGAGGVTDDFPQSRFAGDLILDYATLDRDIDLVFNGDTFDFLKTSVAGRWHTHVTEDRALAKLRRIVQAHRGFFGRLRKFLESRSGRHIHFVVGNHDAELVFPKVQRALRQAIGGSQNIHFPGMAYDYGDLHCEHGHQADALFRVEPEALFAEHNGRRILALPWGSVALLEVAMPLQPMLYHFDRIKPREELQARVPELQDLLMKAYWRYWREAYGSWFGRKDPVKNLGWRGFKEIARRFGSRDANIHVWEAFQERARAGSDWRVCIVGHEHCPGWWAEGGREVLKSSCFRNEFRFGADGAFERLPIHYAEAWMDGDRVRSARLVEIEGPPPPAGYVPESMDAILSQVKQHMDGDDLEGLRRAWNRQERLEERTLG